jgi:hypothetical protein
MAEVFCELTVSQQDAFHRALRWWADGALHRETWRTFAWNAVFPEPRPMPRLMSSWHGESGRHERRSGIGWSGGDARGCSPCS